MALNLNTALSLLGYLRENTYVPTSQVMEHFNLSQKQVKEYLTYLNELSYFEGSSKFEKYLDITVDDDEPGEEWIITRDTLGVNTPLRFTNAQVIAIMGGLKFLESHPEIVNREAISVLIEKLNNAFGTVDESIEIDIDPPNPIIMETLKAAIQSDTCVEIQYGLGTDQSVDTRIIEPIAFWVNENAVTVRAFCRESEGIRSFRVDRILSIAPTELSANSAIPDDGPGVMENAQLSVRLLLEPELLENFAPQTILETKEQGDKIEAHIRVSAFSWIASLVLSNGGQIKVLDPPQLREIVLEKAERWTQLNEQ